MKTNDGGPAGSGFTEGLGGLAAPTKPPKHRYWGAGESGCPQSIKAPNGELHTLMCKVCGEASPKDEFCWSSAPAGLHPSATNTGFGLVGATYLADIKDESAPQPAVGTQGDEDLQTRYELVRSWHADDQRRVNLLVQHLRAVLEVARTWQPDYATKMDRDTLAFAAAEVGHEPPNAKVSREPCKGESAAPAGCAETDRKEN